MTMTTDEACAMIAKWRHGNPAAWTGFGVEAGVAQRLAALDYDHAARLEAHLAALPAKDITPTRVEEAVRATEPDEGMRVVMGIVKAVPLDLLRRNLAKCPVHDVPFYPAAPRIGAGIGCFYHPSFSPNCSCKRCEYRNGLGNHTAWLAAFEWARNHDDDGRPLPGKREPMFCPPKPRRAFRESDA